MAVTANRGLWYPTHPHRAGADDLQRLAFTADTAMTASSVLRSAAQRRHRASILRGSGTVSVPKTTVTTITFLTELYDVGGMVDLATHNERLTVVSGGLYFVSVKLLFSTSGATFYDPLEPSFALNFNTGTDPTLRGMKKCPFAGSAAQWVSCSGVLICAPGDTINAGAWWNSAAAGPWSVTAGQLSAWQIAES